MKYLVEEGMAYPCFCTQEEIDETRKMQELNKERIVIPFVINCLLLLNVSIVLKTSIEKEGN